MRYHQIVNELFDGPPDIKVELQDQFEFATLATISGRTISFGASMVGEIDGKKVWEVAFAEESKENKYAPTVSHFGVTGSGGEVEVFSMVVTSMKIFLQKYSPDVIKFTADKSGASDSRAKLYKRLVNRLIPQGYKLRTSDTTSRTNFWIEKV